MKCLLVVIFFWAFTSSGQCGLADNVKHKRSLQQTILFLSQDSLKGRSTGADGADIAAAFIARKFDSIGLSYSASDSGYFDRYALEYGHRKIAAENVLGILPSKFSNDTTIIFSAHYAILVKKMICSVTKDTQVKMIFLMALMTILPV